MTATEACNLAAQTLRNHQVQKTPLTDGGEGFVDILTKSIGGILHEEKVHGLLLQPVRAKWGEIQISPLPVSVQRRLSLFSEERLAILELAQASGLTLLTPPNHNPWKTSTLGTGELIAKVREQGISKILLGVGGSATIDLGLGALEALGLHFDSAEGPLQHLTPLHWNQKIQIKGTAAAPQIHIACDVDSPLIGPRGATAIFGSQKGLKKCDFEAFEKALKRMAYALCAHCGKSSSLVEVPGTGAAGGTAFGLMVATGAELHGGFDLVKDWLQLKEKVAWSDVVLTGEGVFDRSSLEGKGPGSILKLARTLHKPAFLFAGHIEAALLPLLKDDFPHVEATSMTPSTYPMAKALKETASLLTECLRKRFSLTY